MRLGGRLAAAIEILEDIDRRYRPAAEALRDWGLSHRFAGSKDRAAIGNLVYDALRRRRSSSWLFDDVSFRAQIFGAFMLENALSPKEVNEILDGDDFAPPFLSDDECTKFSGRKIADAPDGVKADCPQWCEALLEEGFGENWMEEGAALAQRPPLDLRVNRLKAEREKVLAALKRTGAAAAPLAPDGIRIAPIEGQGRHPNVQSDPAFQKGWFEVQDVGSQLVALLAEAGPGMQVLDFCAGAGGKTLAMAAAMNNSGQIHAFDADKQRLAPIFDRLRRAACRNVQAIAEEAALEPLANRMDLVLVDAPCTGSGTWRRRPDAKWRLGEKQLEQRQGEQSAILDRAVDFVRPGGRLAYVTCSVFPEENGQQIAAFRARHENFAPVDHKALWKKHFPEAADASHCDAEGGITLTPHRTRTDGFYICVLGRASG